MESLKQAENIHLGLEPPRDIPVGTGWYNGSVFRKWNGLAWTEVARASEPFYVSEEMAKMAYSVVTEGENEGSHDEWIDLNSKKE